MTIPEWSGLKRTKQNTQEQREYNRETKNYRLTVKGLMQFTSFMPDKKKLNPRVDIHHAIKFYGWIHLAHLWNNYDSYGNVYALVSSA